MSGEFKHKIVYLRWLDSVFRDGWHGALDKGDGLSEIHTVGYLVYEDKKYIQLAHSNFIGRDEFGGGLSIPKAVILERRVIKL